MQSLANMPFNDFKGRIFQIESKLLQNQKNNTEAHKETYLQLVFCDLPDAIRQPLSLCQAVLQPDTRLVSLEIC